MRTLLVLAVVALVALAAYAASPSLQAYSRAWIDSALLPFRIAAFIAEPADTTLSVPVEGVRASSISDTYGAPRGEGRTHEGQDIFAPEGARVLPAAEGYVVRVGENRLGGKVVFVAGRGGRGYYYAHLDAHGPDAVPGRFVTAASTIGSVGTTGNAAGTPPHLHFGAYAPDGAIDPLPLLRDS